MTGPQSFDLALSEFDKKTNSWAAVASLNRPAAAKTLTIT